MMSVDQKLDKISDTLTAQAVTLERLTVTVEDHVRRTNIIEADMVPIKKHVWMVNGALKFIGLLGIFAAIAEGITVWLKH
jgi:hypothetical protein